MLCSITIGGRISLKNKMNWANSSLVGWSTIAVAKGSAGVCMSVLWKRKNL